MVSLLSTHHCSGEKQKMTNLPALRARLACPVLLCLAVCLSTPKTLLEALLIPTSLVALLTAHLDAQQLAEGECVTLSSLQSYSSTGLMAVKCTAGTQMHLLSIFRWGNQVPERLASMFLSSRMDLWCRSPPIQEQSLHGTHRNNSRCCW